jgi:hypothetical protein
LEGGVTRIIVGEPERSSYQLAEVESPDPKLLENGIEAADFQLPGDPMDLDFDIDQKSISMKIKGKGAQELVNGYAELLGKESWQKESGILDDEYSFITLAKGDSELGFRARKLDAETTELSISGNGLLWSKPLPTADKRISFGLWLVRNRHLAGLQRLDEFLEEMRKIPPPVPQL